MRNRPGSTPSLTVREPSSSCFVILLLMHVDLGVVRVVEWKESVEPVVLLGEGVIVFTAVEKVILAAFVSGILVEEGVILLGVVLAELDVVRL